jgi:release factor glutamine methyltransferase
MQTAMELQLTAAAGTAAPTLRSALLRGTEFLRDAGIDSAQIDAEVLLGQALGIEKTQLYSALDEPLRAGDRSQFQEMLERRMRREPVAYITGRKEFWSLDFVVTPEVLIPRPETELLVEVALDRLKSAASGTPIILDLGTGSGNIAVCLAKERLEANILAVDTASSALAVAGINSRRHGVSERIDLIQGDLFAALGAEKSLFDLIVSNPPYIRTGELSLLAPEINRWEPMTALDGGRDGIECYRRIIGLAHEYLAPGSSIVLEIGADMVPVVTELFARSGSYEPASVYQDYAGKDRVIAATKVRIAAPVSSGFNDG